MRGRNANCRLLVVGAVVGAVVIGALSPAPHAKADGAGSEASVDVEQETEVGAERETDVGAATRERVHSLARELADTSRKYGTDAVGLQASLLVQALRAGAQGPSEVRVVGPSSVDGADYLRLEVGTGLIFDQACSTSGRCGDRIWRDIAAPVLDRMETFETRPAGLDLSFSYGLQDFAIQVGNKADPAEPYELDHVRITIPSGVLGELADGEITTDQVLDRAAVAHGSEPPVRDAP